MMMMLLLLLLLLLLCWMVRSRFPRSQTRKPRKGMTMMMTMTTVMTMMMMMMRIHTVRFSGAWCVPCWKVQLLLLRFDGLGGCVLASQPDSLLMQQRAQLAQIAHDEPRVGIAGGRCLS